MGARDTSGLKLGTRTRSARSALRRSIATGHVPVAALLLGTVLADDERVALGMTLGDLLGADPASRDRIGRLTSIAGVEVNVRLRDLTTSERRALAVAIEEGSA